MKKSTLFWLILLLCFLLALGRLDGLQQSQGQIQLENTLRRCAISCYALEGFYPPDLAYLLEHYTLSYDEERYTIHYEAIASNLMPEITVVEKQP